MALIFQKTSEIRTSVEALFRFHQDPANLHRINPPGVRVASLRLPKHWKAGARLGVTVKILGIVSQEWEVSLETVSPPCRLVDVAIRGPYPQWRHIHEFREVGPRLSSLTDRVEYLPPWGRLGLLLDRWIFRPQLAVMFAWRHRQTRRLLEQALAPKKNQP
jgi:ligand-binding SRPBCC domain-containing protein